MFITGEIVTVKDRGSFKVFRDLGDEVLLHHPFFEECFILETTGYLNKDAPLVVSSTERSIAYVVQVKDFLDYHGKQDLEALCLCFAIRRELTPRQKHILASLSGAVATIHFDNDINKTIDFINENHALLDDFNTLWFNNFSDLLNKRQPITSKKQRNAIFNMSGFLLAELNNPVVSK